MFGVRLDLDLFNKAHGHFNCQYPCDSIIYSGFRDIIAFSDFLGMLEQSLSCCLLVEHEHIDSCINHGAIGVLFGSEVHESTRHEQVVSCELEIIEVRNGKAIEANVFPQD